MLESALRWILGACIILYFSPGVLAKTAPEVCPIGTTTDEEASFLSLGAQISPSCCQDQKGDCWNDHRGKCVFKWLAGRCDYAIDVCHNHPLANWFCTCCGSCSAGNTDSKCKSAGGRCSKTCYSSEYQAFWAPCKHECCKCCKKKCEGRCANGKGYCSYSRYCKTGYYPSKTEKCNSIFGCTCCVKCEDSPICNQYGGYCDWTSRSCRPGYSSSDDMCCVNPECKCCYAKKVTAVDQLLAVCKSKALEAKEKDLSGTGK